MRGGPPTQHPGAGAAAAPGPGGGAMAAMRAAPLLAALLPTAGPGGGRPGPWIRPSLEALAM
jgi:hypothetical protein